MVSVHAITAITQRKLHREKTSECVQCACNDSHHAAEKYLTEQFCMSSVSEGVQAICSDHTPGAYFTRCRSRCHQMTHNVINGLATISKDSHYHQRTCNNLSLLTMLLWSLSSSQTLVSPPLFALFVRCHHHGTAFLQRRRAGIAHLGAIPSRHTPVHTLSHTRGHEIGVVVVRRGDVTAHAC